MDAPEAASRLALVVDEGGRARLVEPVPDHVCCPLEALTSLELREWVVLETRAGVQHVDVCGESFEVIGWAHALQQLILARCAAPRPPVVPPPWPVE